MVCRIFVGVDNPIVKLYAKRKGRIKNWYFHCNATKKANATKANVDDFTLCF